MKDKSKENEVGNYRLTTCLPLMWKLLTGIVAYEICNHLKENDILPEEQRGCRRNSRVLKDQLLIDKAVIKTCRRIRVRLSMMWIDYRETYDMLTDSRIRKSTKIGEVVETYLIFCLRVWRAGKRS